MIGKVGHLTFASHPNISKAGEICVNTLKKDWQSSLGIGHVLQVVRCLLINPFPESALNEEAGKDFMDPKDDKSVAKYKQHGFH